MAKVAFHVLLHEEDDGSYWAEVEELPGCFASGFSLDELKEAAVEAMQLWLPKGIKLDTPRWAVVNGPNAKDGATKGTPRQMLVSA
jgi:predicted RNase H-like HicB family nuclease